MDRMSSQRPLLDHVFILRFWREKADASGPGQWRVLIRNINARSRNVVDGVADAFAVVMANLDAETSDRDALPRSDQPTRH